MKTFCLILLVSILSVIALGCSNSYQPKVDANIESFSYSDDFSLYSNGEPGAKMDGFKNSQTSAMQTKEQVMNLAKNEVTIKYDHISLYFDDTRDIWKICFSTENLLGGDQTVYMDHAGVTKLIVYGE